MIPHFFSEKMTVIKIDTIALDIYFYTLHLHNFISFMQLFFLSIGLVINCIFYLNIFFRIQHETTFTFSAAYCNYFPALQF